MSVRKKQYSNKKLELGKNKMYVTRMYLSIRPNTYRCVNFRPVSLGKKGSLFPLDVFNLIAEGTKTKQNKL